MSIDIPLFNQPGSRRDLFKLAAGSALFLAGCGTPQPDCETQNGLAGRDTICSDSKNKPESGSFTTILKPDRLLTDPEYATPVQLADGTKDFFVMYRRTLSPTSIQIRLRLQTLPNIDTYMGRMMLLMKSQTDAQKMQQSARQLFQEEVLSKPYRDEWITQIEDDLSGSIKLVFRWKNWKFVDMTWKDRIILRNTAPKA